MSRFILPAVVFVVLIVFLAIGLRLDPSEVPSPLIGKPVPEFSLPTLREPTKQFTSSDLKGQVSLFNVWATWCIACRQEHPALVALASRFDVPIYGLNYKDERELALNWLRDLGDPYAANAFDEDGRVGIEWGVYGAPETFVVDAEGIIRYKHIGPLSEAELNEKILPMVRKLRAQKDTQG